MRIRRQPTSTTPPAASLGGTVLPQPGPANHAVNSQFLHLPQLLYPDVLYVFDNHGRFLATAGLATTPTPPTSTASSRPRQARAFVENAVDMRSIRARTATDNDDRRRPVR